MKFAAGTTAAGLTTLTATDGKRSTEEFALIGELGNTRAAAALPWGFLRAFHSEIISLSQK